MLKYLSCPNELFCGPKFITPPIDGSKLQIRISEWSLHDGDICGYIIQGPDGANHHDRLHVEIASNRRVQVFVAQTWEGAWMPYRDEYDVTADGHVYTAEAAGDYEFNVVAGSNSFQRGQFVLTAWFDKDWDNHVEAPVDQ